MKSANKRKSVLTKTFSFVVAFCLCTSLFAFTALAAPEDEENDDLTIVTVDLTEDDTEDADTEPSTRIVIQQDGEPMDETVVSAEEVAEAATETTETTEKTEEGAEKTTTTTTTEVTEETTRERNQGAFTVDGNGTIQDVIADGTKEFYVITTDNGGVFFLLIDRAGDVNNVYFLSAVDETDIAGFLPNYSYSDEGDYDTVTTTTVTTIEDTETTEADVETAAAAESESSSSSSYTGIIVLLVIVVVVIFVILIWRSQRKNKKNRKSQDNDDGQGFNDDIDIDDDEL